MNRIQQISHYPDETVSDSLASVDSAQFESRLHTPAGRESPHAIFAPLHYEQSYPYPVLVWLHGPGDDERQLKRIMPLVSMRNYVAIAPRGTIEVPRSGEQVAGFGWSQNEDEVTLAEQRVFDVIHAAAGRFSVAGHRVFLAGFDTGGTMAFRVAMNHPTRFAGVLSLGGPFPTGRNPLLRLDDVRSIPLFLASGRDSRQYPASDVCDNLRLFHTAGMAVCLRQYPCGQEISPLMLADMDRWMMDLVAGSKSP